MSCSQNWDSISESVDPAGLDRSHLSCLSWVSASALAPKYWWKCIGLVWSGDPTGSSGTVLGLCSHVAACPSREVPSYLLLLSWRHLWHKKIISKNRLRHIKSITPIFLTRCLLLGFKQSSGPWFLHPIFRYKDELKVLSFLSSQGGTYLSYLSQSWGHL